MVQGLGRSRFDDGQREMRKKEKQGKQPSNYLEAVGTDMLHENHTVTAAQWKRGPCHPGGGKQATNLIPSRLPF